jgi:hypothetical protein
VKAGVIAGLAYIGALAAFNLSVLYVAKQDVLSYISTNFSQLCSPAGSPGRSTVQDCFDSLAPVYIPYIAFSGFFVTLAFSAAFGRMYDRIPGKGQSFKGLLIAPLVAATLVLLQLVGFTFELAATEALIVVVLGSTVAYGLLLGSFYRRYTRLIRFESEDLSSLRILVDSSDLTGRTATLAAKSTHNVEAKVEGDSSFKGWTVSGGVTVEDAKSFETSMEINGDGLLKGLVSKKH